MTTVETPDLPVFPVIVIHLSQSTIIADAPGADPVAVSVEDVDQGDPVALNAVGARAAAEVAEQLELHVVKVRIDLGEDEHWMWLDTATQMLHPLETTRQERQEQQTHTQRSRARRRRLAIATIIVMVGLIVAALVWRLFFFTPKDDGPPPPPGSAQLPVAAPAGWDTYADWSVPAADVDPLIEDGQIVFADADGRDVVTARTSDGVETSRHGAGFQIRGLHATSGLGENVIAVEGSSSEAAVGKIGEGLHKMDAPQDDARLTWVSGVPVFTAPGFVWVPDAEGQLSKRTAPAETDPVIVDGSAVWMASTKELQAWRIDSDQPRLPDAVTLPSKKGAGDYDGPVAAVGKHLILGFKTEKDSTTSWELVNLDGEEFTATGWIKAATSGGQPTIDPQKDMVLSSGILLDLSSKKAMSVGGTATYGAGYAWVTGTKPQRISPDGQVTDWKGGEASSSTAAIPAALDDKGRAAVVIKSGSQDGRLYMLSKKDDGKEQS